MPIQVEAPKSLKTAPFAVLATLALIALVLALGWKWILFVFIVLAALAGWSCTFDRRSPSQDLSSGKRLL